MSVHDMLAGRWPIVTGAATAIGQHRPAFPEGAATRGTNVMMADIHAADETVAAVQAAGGKARAVRVDVADDESVLAMARATMAPQLRQHLRFVRAQIGWLNGALASA